MWTDSNLRTMQFFKKWEELRWIQEQNNKNKYERANKNLGFCFQLIAFLILHSIKLHYLKVEISQTFGEFRVEVLCIFFISDVNSAANHVIRPAKCFEAVHTKFNFKLLRNFW